MGGIKNQASFETNFSQPSLSTSPFLLSPPNFEGRTIANISDTNSISPSQILSLKYISEENLHNEAQIKVNNTIDFERNIEISSTSEIQLFYYVKEDSGDINIYQTGTNPEEEKKADFEERIVGIKDNGENEIEFIGRSKARKAINDAQQNNNNINLKKSDGKSVEVKQFTFRKLNDNEKAFFNSAIKAHLLFLENQSRLNKIKKEKTSDSSSPTVNYNNSTNTNQVKEKILHNEEKSFYVQAEPTERFTKRQLHKLQEKFLEVAIIKEAKAEEQEKKRLEKKLADKNFFEFKYVQSEDMLSKPNIKTSLLIVKIIKKFNFNPQISTCTLRTI